MFLINVFIQKSVNGIATCIDPCFSFVLFFLLVIDLSFLILKKGIILAYSNLSINPCFCFVPLFSSLLEIDFS